MKTPPFGIVLTTIYDGGFLQDYRKHLEEHNQLDQVRFYVVADLRTPETCRRAVDEARDQGVDVVYLSPDDQRAFLMDFPELEPELPWNTDNRRNVGFLMAYRDKCATLLAIDDDNYPKAKWPFLDGHSSVGHETSLQCASGYGGWFNLCSMMKIDCTSLGGGDTVYARGFPYSRRDTRCARVSDAKETGFVAINAGLWSGDPDVDAATRLVTGCVAEEAFDSSFLLGVDTLMPINTQNTALIRDAIPAYYYVKMGHPVAGMKLDRFGDIFSGFFVQKCARSVGHRVRVGSPVVDHRRSPHNLYKDLWYELAGMVLTDDMLPLLETPLCKTPNYSVAALELSERIESWAGGQSGFLWDEALKGYFGNVAANTRLWVSACEMLK